jgi:hypothetical protein
MWRNRTVCLLGITVAVSAAGCVIQDASDPHGGYGGPPGGGHDTGPRIIPGPTGVSVAFELATLDGKLTDCAEVDTPTATLHATLRATGTHFAADFPCEAGAAALEGLPAGLYDVSLDLLDAGGRAVSGFDLPGLQVWDGSVTTPAQAAVIPVQTWDVGWSISVTRPNGLLAAVTCADVGATTVEFTAQRSGEAPETYQLSCEDYGVITTAIPPGEYQVRALLLDRRGRLLGDTGVGSVSVGLDAPATLDADFTL